MIESNKIQVESAKHQADARGRFHAAEQTLKKRRKMFAVISALQKTGGTSNSEIDRAEMELVIAESKLTEAREEIVDRELALKRANVQLERRWIRAPFSGVVALIHREEGEFLSPLNPEILTLVQVDQLLAVFNLPRQSTRLTSGRTTRARFTIRRTKSGRARLFSWHSNGGKERHDSVKVKIDNMDGTDSQWRAMFAKSLNVHLNFRVQPSFNFPPTSPEKALAF